MLGAVEYVLSDDDIISRSEFCFCLQLLYIRLLSVDQSNKRWGGGVMNKLRSKLSIPVIKFRTFVFCRSHLTGDMKKWNKCYFLLNHVILAIISVHLTTLFKFFYFAIKIVFSHKDYNTDSISYIQVKIFHQAKQWACQSWRQIWLLFFFATLQNFKQQCPAHSFHHSSSCRLIFLPFMPSTDPQVTIIIFLFLFQNLDHNSSITSNVKIIRPTTTQ